jgi:L-2,4-diaminobutyrate decarboxylase
MTLLNPTVTLEDIKLLLALVETTAEQLPAA